MTIQLPQPISYYFAASNGSDANRVTACFTEDAAVFDEKKAYHGPEAIAQWFLATRKQYQYTATPVSITAEGDSDATVVADIVGNFPGSPVQLKYSFLLSEGKIQSLEIC